MAYQPSSYATIFYVPELGLRGIGTVILEKIEV